MSRSSMQTTAEAPAYRIAVTSVVRTSQFARLVPLLRRSAARVRYPLVGCAVLLFALEMIIVGQASEIERTQSFGRMAELIPSFLQRGLGSQALLLASFKGTIAFGYFHPVVMVMVCMLAIFVTTEPAYEVEAGLVDLTLARPVPRHLLVTRSLLLATGAVGVAALLMASGTWIGLRLFASPRFDAPSPTVVLQLLLHLGSVAACFGAFALAVAARSSRWSTAFTTGALTVAFLYLVDFLAIAWPSVRPLARLSPFHYYPALSILTGDAPPWQNLAILLSATSMLCVFAYWQFSRRDV